MVLPIPMILYTILSTRLGTSCQDAVEEHPINGHRTQVWTWNKIDAYQRHSANPERRRDVVPDYDSRFNMGADIVRERLLKGYTILRLPRRVLELVPEAQHDKIVIVDL